MPQVDLITLKPIPKPTPEPNVFMYCETVTLVEEIFKGEEFVERPAAKEITTKIFYCEYAEFDSNGYCHGGCDSDADYVQCMKLSEYMTKSGAEITNDTAVPPIVRRKEE